MFATVHTLAVLNIIPEMAKVNAYCVPSCDDCEVVKMTLRAPSPSGFSVAETCTAANIHSLITNNCLLI